MTAELSEQIAELQIILMDQQQTMEDFSAQLIGFGERLARLEQKQEILEDRVKQLVEMPGEKTGADDEQPPHY